MSACSSFSHYTRCYLCLLAVVALFHLCLCSPNFDDVLCMEGERQALLEFKEGLIDEADRLASWLRHLDLSCNAFGWMEVPKFIGSLENIKHLNLSYSEFSGTIPPQLGNLSQLNVLSLGESGELMNMRWLSSLHQLHHLDLSGADLSKHDWLEVINTLPSLVELHLSSCQLVDMHHHVSSLNITSLSLLDLSFNNFNSSLPLWIFSITSLVSLDLTLCNFHGPIPSSFRNLTSLQVLHVSENDFMNSSLVFEELSNSNLISLDIRSCGVSSSVLDSLHNLTSLLNLYISDNQLTMTPPKSLCNFCNLKEVDFSHNHYFQSISLTYLLESFLECKTPALESLVLSSLGLSGQLPSQLGLLSSLRALYLSSNLISGQLPNSIGMLSFLRTLDLSYNLISGHIPFSIGQLSLLEVLFLQDNNLNGSLPDSIGRLSSLKELHLSYNQLEGSLPNSLSELSNLEEFYFFSNSLTGVVTETHFAKLFNLKYLYGGGNNLTLRLRHANWIPPFQLQRLNLNSWRLGPQFPLWLQSQNVSDPINKPNPIKKMIIINNNGTNPPPSKSIVDPHLLPSPTRSLPNLCHVDMSYNHIQGTLSSFPERLRSLDLRSNDFSGKLPHLSDMPPVLLDLSNNYFEGSLHHMLCPYKGDGMRVLNLGNNRLSGVIPECWENWTWLIVLNLENNNLSGGIPRTLSSLYNLKSLNMHGNKLSGRLPDSLLNLTNLKILQLGGNELVGSIPTWLGTKLSFLTLVNLRSNKFDGNVPTEICYLAYIQILDLADNNLVGNIPRCFNNFSVFSGKQNASDGSFWYRSVVVPEIVTASDSLVMKGREDTYSTILPLVLLLDLSNNNLSGPIPSELTALTKLKTLNLSRNHLTGTIPEKIGDMKSLETCDISRNKLFGELPLRRVPSGTQLQSFDESSFFGNQLCGAPLADRCIEVERPGTKDHEKDDGSHGAESADWGLVISMVLGFIFGFWVIVAPLIVSKSWRIGYFRLLSKLRYMVYDVIHKYCFNIFTK
ncbi:leucine-rich repeat protein [Artemisia annua]|uniref:Leucine-rich repeat protein n=1 Tax=Artemisia annua TaxID=35608 RepID=A0A2U1L5L3_ARTAN|nr:leucine-rich repeat protein [Artemisia annua]